MRTRCPACGKKNDGAFCVVCGTPAPTEPIKDDSPAKGNIFAWFRELDTLRKVWIVGGLFLVFPLLVFIILPSRTPPDINDNTFTGNQEPAKEVVPESAPIAPSTPPVSNPPPAATPSDIQGEPPFQEAEVSATVEQLTIDRQTGGISAAQKYVGKVVEVQGIVDTADSTGKSPSISFKATGLCPISGGNEIDCFWMEERERIAVAKLHPGDSVTVLGKFDESGRYEMPKEYDIPGCAYYIHLHNCTVKEPSQTSPPPEAPVPNGSVVPNAEPGQNPQPETPGWHRFSWPSPPH